MKKLTQQQQEEFKKVYDEFNEEIKSHFRKNNTFYVYENDVIPIDELLKDEEILSSPVETEEEAKEVIEKIEDEFDSQRLVNKVTEKIEDDYLFDEEVIYYEKALEYLKDNDPSLHESMKIAEEYGYTTDKLNSELLASLLASKNNREDYYDMIGAVPNDIETSVQDVVQKMNDILDGEDE